MSLDTLSKIIHLIADASRDGYYLNITPEDIMVVHYYEDKYERKADITTRHGVIVEIRLTQDGWLWVQVRPVMFCDCTCPEC